MNTIVKEMCKMYANDIIRSFENHYNMWEARNINKTSIDVYKIIMFFCNRRNEYKLSLNDVSDITGININKIHQIANHKWDIIVPASIKNTIYKACLEKGIHVYEWDITEAYLDVIYDTYKDTIDNIWYVL